jgi:hypothetical protein
MQACLSNKDEFNKLKEMMLKNIFNFVVIPRMAKLQHFELLAKSLYECFGTEVFTN